MKNSTNSAGTLSPHAMGATLMTVRFVLETKIKIIMTKKVFIKIVKKAERRYLIEERHTFMFFFRFYIKGSIKLRLPKYWSDPKVAEQQIYKRAAAKGYHPFIVFIGK